MSYTTTGRAGVAPSRDGDDRRRAQRPREDTALVLCAGCGATLPAGEVIVVDLMAADVRCDLCWRSLLAAEAAQWRRVAEIQKALETLAKPHSSLRR